MIIPQLFPLVLQRWIFPSVQFILTWRLRAYGLEYVGRGHLKCSHKDEVGSKIKSRIFEKYMAVRNTRKLQGDTHQCPEPALESSGQPYSGMCNSLRSHIIPLDSLVFILTSIPISTSLVMPYIFSLLRQTGIQN